MSSSPSHCRIKLFAPNRSFDAQTGRLNVQTVNGGSSKSWQQQYDLVGNLMRRDDFSTGQNEVMVYDKLDRLKSVSRNNTVSIALEYDVLGNICQKTREGVVQNYQYGASSGCALNAGAVSSPHQVTQAWGKSYQYVSIRPNPPSKVIANLRELFF